MDIKSAEFLISNTDVKKCPPPDRLEYAFIGRSNVGKSSLINMLTNKKNLAMISARPGKTRLINHFLINDSWYLVDLPGYGYAQIGKNARKSFSKIIETYITRRENLTALFVLIDSRHDPQKIDIEFIEWLGSEGIPFTIVFTKTDKLSASKISENISNYSQRLLADWEELPPMLATSSLKKEGRDELLDYIDSINDSLSKSSDIE